MRHLSIVRLVLVLVLVAVPVAAQTWKTFYDPERAFHHQLARQRSTGKCFRQTRWVERATNAARADRGGPPDKSRMDRAVEVNCKLLVDLGKGVYDVVTDGGPE